MWIADLKIALCFYICTIVTAYNYHTSKWKERLQQTSVNSDNNDIYNVKLRHSHYPNLDRVMTKIDNIQKTTQKPTKLRHWKTTTTDEGLFEDYGDLEDYEDEDDDIWKDATDTLDDEYEDDSLIDNEWQAEEATEPQIKAPISAITEYKWTHYGTRPKVEESRRQHLHLQPTNEQTAVNAVVEHYMKVRQEGQCRKPLPKVIPVQSIHPDPSKTYTPHCTILHRCAEDTGCCINYTTKCGPKTQVLIQLYFYIKTLGSSETKVEKLSFYNHTECACLENNHTTTTLDSAHSRIAVRSANRPETIRRCKCPVEFIPKYRYEAVCSCDCEESNHACLSMKKGNEHLGYTDRKCILDNECGVPVCEYGVYLKQIGRCPRKKDKLETYKKLTRT